MENMTQLLNPTKTREISSDELTDFYIDPEFVGIRVSTKNDIRLLRDSEQEHDVYPLVIIVTTGYECHFFTQEQNFECLLEGADINIH